MANENTYIIFTLRLSSVIFLYLADMSFHRNRSVTWMNDYNKIQNTKTGLSGFTFAAINAFEFHLAKYVTVTEVL